jgi:hypothetical protein
MVKTTGVLVFSLILFAQGCKKTAMDFDYPLYVQNNAEHSIKVYVNNDAGYKALYPDTVIADFKERLTMEIRGGEKKSVAGGSARWESVFEVSVLSDTLSLFILHQDTLSKYPWQEIRKGYRILKRYDLTLEDLKRLDFNIPYPPDSRMNGVKMYPK